MIRKIPNGGEASSIHMCLVSQTLSPIAYMEIKSNILCSSVHLRKQKKKKKALRKRKQKKPSPQYYRGSISEDA
jgi:hypothetical protein